MASITPAIPENVETVKLVLKQSNVRGLYYIALEDGRALAAQATVVIEHEVNNISRVKVDFVLNGDVIIEGWKT